MNKHSLSPELVAQAFSQAASTYYTQAVVDSAVAEQMRQRLELFKIVPTHILDVGCGTGEQTQKLQAYYSTAHLTGIDIAPGMIELARRRHPALEFSCASVNHLPFSAHSFDLVFSNMCFHWCNDLTQIFKECYRVLRPGGLLIFSMAGPDTLKELRASWAEIDHYPHVHYFPDLHNVGDALIQSAFQEPVMDIDHYQLLYPTLYQLLQELQLTGSRNVLEDRRRGLMSRAQFKQLESAYETYRTHNQRLPLSYEITYGHAWVGLNKGRSSLNKESGEVRVNIEDIFRR